MFKLIVYGVETYVVGQWSTTIGSAVYEIGRTAISCIADKFKKDDQHEK